MKTNLIIATLLLCSIIADLNAWGSDDVSYVRDAAGRSSGTPPPPDYPNQQSEKFQEIAIIESPDPSENYPDVSDEANMGDEDDVSAIEIDEESIG